mgnify:CR=1 FL=1
MKRICTCLLAAALVVGAFTGCAAKPAAGTDTTTKPETTTETTTVTTTENTKTTFRESYTSTIYPALQHYRLYSQVEQPGNPCGAHLQL